MSEMYVFGPKEVDNDYSSMGLVGALEPTECLYTPEANGDMLITITHPVDEFEKYKALLVKGNILVTSVPVRTTPEIQNGSCVTTVWTYKVKPLSQLTAKSQRTLYKKKTGSASIKILNAGDVVTVVIQSEEDNIRWKVKSKYGTGWIDPNGFVLVTRYLIADNSNAIQEIQSPWVVTPQYFRIYEKEIGIGSVTVKARHVAYSLLYNMTRYNTEASVSLQTALDGILGNCYIPHDFKAYTNVSNTVAGLFYKRKNPIDCFFNPESGICKRFNVGMVCDNYELFFLKDPGINRGIRIEYQKNMLGITFNSSDDSVATRIVPYGETKDGKDLLLDSDPTKQYIDSPNINAYAEIHAYELKCDKCKVGDKDENGGTITEAVAKARMRQQVQDLLDSGCDQPTIEMDVTFVNLGDTEEYAQFKDLENCFLFDYVVVRHPDFNIDVTAQIVGMTWNCLTDKLESVKIGSVGKTLANTGVSDWEIPSGFNGSKIGDGTIGSRGLGQDIISARHVQADSINADALQANSVTAIKLDAVTVNAQFLEVVKAKFQEIVTQKLTTDSLYAALADIITLKVGDITADKIDTDALYAAFADIIALNLQNGNFDVATIKNLLAEAMSITVGSAGELYIENLVVTDATFISGAFGQLILKSPDGKYYEIIINSDGTMTTKEVTVTDGEFNAGQTNGGKKIIETVVNIEDLNAKKLSAAYANIVEIITASITAGKLNATEAFLASAVVPQLYATSIEALSRSLDLTVNETFKVLIETDGLVKKWFSFTDDGLVIGEADNVYKSKSDNDGFHIIRDGKPITSMSRDGTNTDAIRPLSLTGIAIRATSTGGWTWTDAS